MTILSLKSAFGLTMTFHLDNLSSNAYSAAYWAQRYESLSQDNHVTTCWLHAKVASKSTSDYKPVGKFSKYPNDIIQSFIVSYCNLTTVTVRHQNLTAN